MISSFSLELVRWEATVRQAQHIDTSFKIAPKDNNDKGKKGS